jgi:hypothetical protein
MDLIGSDVLSRSTMLETPFINGSVLSDTQTCWVNLHGVCLARFGSQGFQVGPTWTHGTSPGDRDWKQFCESVHKAFRILVVEYHRPTWVQGTYQALQAG